MSHVRLGLALLRGTANVCGLNPFEESPTSMPDDDNVPRLGEAERMRLRQLEMEREMQAKITEKGHRQLVGGMSAAAYEAARADHASISPHTRSEFWKGPCPRRIPSI
eukprot:CAMPEP_0113554962 /NCGR_PEP_ID=MMETSP0015_2-20120614/16447_1 /TAXON_ID=2838 /ORGANISM="Odontella" /LENGTH=107 /DNA_ID=CAMNT_0000456175 /DNA_START=407 /DNA_END=730 /DNA_ORIENTATION=- /assembly_acc=CAM_ASM_000160